MKPRLTAILLLLCPVLTALGQQADTVLVQDAVYSRPFIASAGAASIGGYVEGNTNYFAEDGVTEGLTMELRRFNIFLYSAISTRLRLISELEFEHGTEEINLETAQVDFQISPGLVLRGGILLVPIGAFNQNHDAPQWDFVERPLVSTEVIPTTLSEVGFGVNGKFFQGAATYSYDLYLTNGLGDGVILNDQGRTHLPAGKRAAQFEEDNNGSPALSGRLAARHRRLGEVGLSYYGGVYNTYRIEGTAVDEKRRFALFAVDFDTEVASASVRGEVVMSQVDVPGGLEELFGERQWGFHVDVVVPVLRRRVLSYPDAVLNAGIRLERVDFNVGTFASTGGSRDDEMEALVLGLSFRPTPGTVLRFNYRHAWFRDLLSNPAVRTAGYQFGLATYF